MSAPVCKVCNAQHWPREGCAPDAVARALAKLRGPERDKRRDKIPETPPNLSRGRPKSQEPSAAALRQRQRRKVLKRSGGRCEHVEAGVRCAERAVHVHHREHRGMGGRKGLGLVANESLENLEAVCLRHHNEKHGV